MDRATALLLATELPIKVVAAECGVGDLYHFHRLFKKHRHEPPGQFRRNHRRTL